MLNTRPVNIRRRQLPGLVLAAASLIAGLPSGAAGHEIPTDITVLAFVKPEGRNLQLLVRVPLEAMRDIEFPTWGFEYLDLARADPYLRDAAMLWIAGYAQLYEGSRRLTDPAIRAIRVSLPSDRSFGTYEDALRHVTTSPRLPADAELYWAQGMLDVLLEYPIESDQSEFSIRPGFEWLALRVTVALQYLPSDDVVRAYYFQGDPGLIRLDPRWHHAALSFVRLGFWHILEGTDHLLFLLCLVIPFRRLRPLVIIVTSFTVAHSITLGASALGHAPDALWFPPLVEMLIAASIVYMALENIVGVGSQRRWVLAFAFGLVHGFGFSFILGETLQFAGPHVTMSLLAFNIGVEIGQLFVLVLMIPALEFLFRRVVAERVGAIILSALVAHTAWHWMETRAADLGEFAWPVIDAAMIAGALRWLMVLVVLAGLLWLVSGPLRQWTEGRTGRTEDQPVG